MPISPVRVAAFEILMRAETTDAYASELLHSARFAKLSPADHGLLTELVMGVLRWRDVLDEAIAQHSGQALAKFDPEVLTALRLGAYQLLFLDRVPRHAAVNESVELVKRARKRSATGLLNAVLRKIHIEEHTFPEYAGHPQWLVERWKQAYGEDAARKICSHDQNVPKTTVRLSKPEYLAELQQEGIRLEPGVLLQKAFIITSGDLARTNLFPEHKLAIQDEASQLVALLVGKGNAILDCCAAPGGKTRILAEQNPRAAIISVELHPRRAALIKKLVPLPNVRVIAADARALPFREGFDRVLVDAPCTGTGTLARNPEIKWRLKAEDILRLQAYQLEILSAAMRLVSPGGRVVYSTCSLEPEENEQVVEKALEQNTGFRVVSCREALQALAECGELTWKEIDSLVSGPYLRTIPGVHPCDGFFAAIIERV